MTGHRKESGQPRRAVTRSANQRKRFFEKMARATTPSERMGHAMDFLRARLARQDPATIERAASTVTQFLVRLADELDPARAAAKAGKR